MKKLFASVAVLLLGASLSFAEVNVAPARAMTAAPVAAKARKHHRRHRHHRARKASAAAPSQIVAG